MSRENYTFIFRGFKVEHYASEDSALVYTDYCYTQKKYATLCAKYESEGLIRNAGRVRNAKVFNDSEFSKIVETLELKSDAQKEFERKAALKYGSYEEYRRLKALGEPVAV